MAGSFGFASTYAKRVDKKRKDVDAKMTESYEFTSTYEERVDIKRKDVDAKMADSYEFASTYVKREAKTLKVDARMYESRITASKPAVQVIRWELGTDSNK